MARSPASSVTTSSDTSMLQLVRRDRSTVETAAWSTGMLPPTRRPVSVTRPAAGSTRTTSALDSESVRDPGRPDREAAIAVRVVCCAALRLAADRADGAAGSATGAPRTGTSSAPEGGSGRSRLTGAPFRRTGTEASAHRSRAGSGSADPPASSPPDEPRPRAHGVGSGSPCEDGAASPGRPSRYGARASPGERATDPRGSLCRPPGEARSVKQLTDGAAMQVGRPRMMVRPVVVLVRRPRAAGPPPRRAPGERRRACAGHGGCGSGWCCR
jgi:hypothetical protein